MAVTIELNNRQQRDELQLDRLVQAADQILHEAGYTSGQLSLVVVSDPDMHELNRDYLKHDYPTDVLSFLLEHDEAYLEGEVIVSADTASSSALDYGWSTADELLLYAIHGTLHLIGMDDHDDAGRAAMREAESQYLARFGLKLPGPPESPGSSDLSDKEGADS